MTRLLYRAVLAFLLTATGLCLVVLMPQAARTQPGNALPEGVGAVALLYAGTLTLVYACRVAWHVGRADSCRWYHRKQQAERRATPGPTDAEQQHAEAMAAVAAEPMQPQTVGYTAVMPTVQTNITWGFGPAGVIQPPPSEPWTPAVPVLGGRHAGMPSERDELDLSVWGAHAFEVAR